MGSSVDIEAVRSAVDALLRALGHPPESDPELRDTPARVAHAWVRELLDGYARAPEDVLGDGVAARDPGFVMVGNVRFAMMCPHHLMPGLRRAWVGYLPGHRVAGIGTLVRLVETFAHRLVLQESVGQNVADALVDHLGAQGAGVLIRARHNCLSTRGEKQADARVVTLAFAGSFARDTSARDLFLHALPTWAKRHAP